MGQASTIGLDIAKRVFQAHGADATGRVVFRKRLVRAKVLEFFAGQPRCLVALEACGGAHYWARELGKLGHTVRLIPPAYVKPFVKRQKNDVADAEAICEAAQRPGMRFVPVKEEAQQANTVVQGAGQPLGDQTHHWIRMRSEHRRGFGDRIGHRSFGKGGSTTTTEKFRQRLPRSGARRTHVARAAGRTRSLGRAAAGRSKSVPIGFGLLRGHRHRKEMHCARDQDWSSSSKV